MRDHGADELPVADQRLCAHADKRQNEDQGRRGVDQGIQRLLLYIDPIITNISTAIGAAITIAM